jgi:transposase InsO family protein
MAVGRRRPGAGLVHHSDQGSQYVSLAFGQRARDAGIAVLDISLSALGRKFCPSQPATHI